MAILFLLVKVLISNVSILELVVTPNVIGVISTFVWKAVASNVLLSILVSTLVEELKVFISNSGVEVVVCKEEVESIILFVSYPVFIESILSKLKVGVALKSEMVSTLEVSLIWISEELYVCSFVFVIKALISKEGVSSINGVESIVVVGKALISKEGVESICVSNIDSDAWKLFVSYLWVFS